mmetsp:Transcript_106946/g.319796  ORF Transcript_106946/g.319796 Transcript_106946/m.319796 type:complete len:214 (+) Transcript_106946:133-774(+)
MSLAVARAPSPRRTPSPRPTTGRLSAQPSPALSGLATPRTARGRQRRPEDDPDMVRSLQIKNDERFIAMNRYKEASSGGQVNAHFARILQNRGASARPSGRDSPKASELELPAIRGSNTGIDQRMQWQEAFDTRVRRLLVDFQLSDEPSCRLKHLDRMHDWFEEHGAKQIRKTQEGPNFITADRTGRMPAGSTKDIPPITDVATQLLSSTLKR